MTDHVTTLEAKNASSIFAKIDSDDSSIYEIQTHAAGPTGTLPLDSDFL